MNPAMQAATRAHAFASYSCEESNSQSQLRTIAATAAGEVWMQLHDDNARLPAIEQGQHISNDRVVAFDALKHAATFAG